MLRHAVRSLLKPASSAALTFVVGMITMSVLLFLFARNSNIDTSAVEIITSPFAWGLPLFIAAATLIYRLAQNMGDGSHHN